MMLYKHDFFHRDWDIPLTFWKMHGKFESLQTKMLTDDGHSTFLNLRVAKA
jgi:hypothetical protein